MTFRPFGPRGYKKVTKVEDFFGVGLDLFYRTTKSCSQTVMLKGFTILDHKESKRIFQVKKDHILNAHCSRSIIIANMLSETRAF